MIIGSWGVIHLYGVWRSLKDERGVRGVLVVPGLEGSLSRGVVAG